MSGDLRERLASVICETWERVESPYSASYVATFLDMADALLPLIHAECDKARAEALRPVHALFNGGPDTACRTTWPDGVECIEVPAVDLRAALTDCGHPNHGQADHDCAPFVEAVRP